jgi:hypothetical protein
VSAEPSALPSVPVSQSQSADFGRAAMAILVTMVVLIVALTGILVETTWGSPAGSAEVLQSPADPGSLVRR